MAHHEPFIMEHAPLLSKRPPVVIYCDFDGVINTFPFEVNLHPNPSTPEYDIPGQLPLPRHNEDTADYAYVYHERLKTDERLLYPVIDQESYIHAYDPRSYAYGEEYSRRHTYYLYWSSEVVNTFLKHLQNGSIEFRWCTTWTQQAPIHLTPTLGLPDVPYIPLSTKEGPVKPHLWNAEKALAVYELHTSDTTRVRPNALEVYNPHMEDLRQDQRPFIWLDDVATRAYAMKPSQDNPNLYEHNHKLLPKHFNLDTLPPHLILKTDEILGLSFQDLNAINSFVEDHSSDKESDSNSTTRGKS